MALFDNQLATCLVIVVFDVVLLVLLDKEIIIPLPQNSWIYYSCIFLLSMVIISFANYKINNMASEDIAYLSILMGIARGLLFNKSKAVAKNELD